MNHLDLIFDSSRTWNTNILKKFFHLTCNCILVFSFTMFLLHKKIDIIIYFSDLFYHFIYLSSCISNSWGHESSCLLYLLTLAHGRFFPVYFVTLYLSWTCFNRFYPVLILFFRGSFVFFPALTWDRLLC